MKRFGIIGWGLAVGLSAASSGAGPNTSPWLTSQNPTRLDWLAMTLTAEAGGNACLGAECASATYNVIRGNPEIVVTIKARPGVPVDHAFAARAAGYPLDRVLSVASSMALPPPMVILFTMGSGTDTTVNHYRCDLRPLVGLQNLLVPKFEKGCVPK